MKAGVLEIKENKVIRLGLSILFGLNLLIGFMAIINSTSPAPVHATEQFPHLKNQAIILAAPIYSSAQTTVSIDASPANSKQAQQGFPAVAYNSTNNQFFVIWTDFRNDNGGATDPWEDPDIYGHRLDSSGSLIGASNTGVSDTSDDQTQNNPDLLYNPDRNEYLAVWRKYNGSPSSPNVRIQTTIVADTGAAGAPNDISGSNTKYKYNPAAVYGPGCNSGEYFVVWPNDSSSNTGEDYDIKASRVVTNTGAATGSEITVSNAISSQLFPEVAYNSATPSYFVVWQGFESASMDIYGQRLDCNGSPQGSVITITTNSSVQVHPTVVYNSSRDEYLVVWEDYRNGSADVYGQRLQSDGTLEGTNFAIVNASGDQNSPKVAYDSQILINGTDRYLVVWEDLRSNGSYQIYGQLLRGDGSVTNMGNNFTIASVTRNQRNPNLAYNSTADAFLITWADESSPGNATLDTDIFSRLMTFTPEEPFLSISKNAPFSAITGDPVTYTLTIVNSGAITASNLVITDTIPPGATYVSGGTKVSNVVSWTVGTLGPNNASVETSFIVTATNTITNNDYGVRADGDYNANSNQPVVTIVGPAAPIFSLSKSGPATALVGGQINYTVTITNNGTAMASNVLITDVIPAGATYISGGAKVGNVVSFSVASLSIGAKVERSFTVSATTSITNDDYMASANGVWAVGQEAITTLIVPPTANFSATPLAGTIPLTVSFTNLALNPLHHYLWDFGDGETSTATNPSHTYLIAQAYTVTLSATDGGITTTMTKQAYITAANQFTDLVAVGQSWRYFKGSQPVPANWQALGFDDSGWLSGPSGIGYENPDAASSWVLANLNTILTDMENSYFTVFARKSFNVITSTGVVTLALGISYDDGFIAYLNNTAVVTVNVVGTAYNDSATDNHEADKLEFFDLTPYLHLINSGQNVLAVQGHNAEVNSSDFVLIPVLKANLNNIKPPPPTPNLLITKIGPALALSGETIAYDIVVSNNGTGEATNLVITDILPAGANYVSGGSLNGNEVSWSAVATLAINSQVTKTLTVSPTASVITNSVYGVTADGNISVFGVSPVTTQIFSQTTAAFIGTPLNGTIPLTVNFTNQSIAATQYLWDFGDGLTSTQSSPSHTYYKSGVYTVSLLAGNGFISNTKTRPAYITTNNLLADLIKIGDTWRYFKGIQAPPANWNGLSFDDSSWPSDFSGFGYADGDDATVLDDMMQELPDTPGYLTVFIRKPFTIVNPSGVVALDLQVDYDDGFAAYLNGTWIWSKNADNTAWNDIATGEHEVPDPRTFDMTPYTYLLRPGQNILAIQGHNIALNSSDFSLLPALSIEVNDLTPPTVTNNGKVYLPIILKN